MKRLVLAVMVVALVVVVVAPKLAKLYPQQFGWYSSLASEVSSVNIPGLKELRQLFSAVSSRGSDSAGPAGLPPSGAGPASAAASSGPSMPATQQRALTDWEKAQPLGKGQVRAIEAAPATAGIVVGRSKPIAAPAVESPKPLRLSAHTVVISGEINEPTSDSVADAARRSRKNTQPEPSR